MTTGWPWVLIHRGHQHSLNQIEFEQTGHAMPCTLRSAPPGGGIAWRRRSVPLKTPGGAMKLVRFPEHSSEQ